MSRRAALDATSGTALPLMAYAMIDAEKLRRRKMSEQIKVRLGAGQTAIAMTVDQDSPIKGMMLRAINCTEQGDGSLRVVFRNDFNGVKFSEAQSNPGKLNYSETWKHSAKHLAGMPRFGKTECLAVIEGDKLVVTVPALREPLTLRTIKSKEGRALPLLEPAVTGPTRDEFREAVRLVNAFKARMGDALELRINEEGQLRGAIMEEFG